MHGHQGMDGVPSLQQVGAIDAQLVCQMLGRDA